ncbi:MAG: rRNA pseudouridine synthase [Chloroflexi bacterium]|nr:MAG: rRNA pseudouridine synthase [Chloroflexota bacterium]
MRLNHYLARAGIAARRKADQLIDAGEVAVNGEPARRGQQVTPGVDQVRIQGRLVELAAERAYLMMNKPTGVLTSVGDRRGRPTVTDDHVVIDGQPEPATLRRLARGLVIAGERFEPIDARVLSTDAKTARIAMVLHEGRKREIRRLWQALGYRVLDLQRVRIDGLHLGTLKEGKRRPLTAAEVARLKAAVS